MFIFLPTLSKKLSKLYNFSSFWKCFCSELLGLIQYHGGRFCLQYYYWPPIFLEYAVFLSNNVFYPKDMQFLIVVEWTARLFKVCHFNPLATISRTNFFGETALSFHNQKFLIEHIANIVVCLCETTEQQREKTTT